MRSSPGRWTRGAADYLLKPVSPTELAARIRAALRKQDERAQREAEPPYRCADLVIRHSERDVSLAGQPLRLSPTEYDLLAELSLQSGRTLPHGLLLERIWGLRDAPDSKLVHASVKRLRRKLGDDARKPRYIFTDRGVGYRIAPTE